MEPAYLNDSTILPWERPTDGISSLDEYDGKTEPLDCRGILTLDETVGHYRVVGSATKYLANISRLGPNMWVKELTNPLARCFLFSGGIQIYRLQDNVPGTEFEGYDLEHNGRIWMATSPLEEEFQGVDALKHLVLTPHSEERIDAILTGYQTQADERRKARYARDKDTFARGRETGEADPRYKGSGPC